MKNFMYCEICNQQKGRWAKVNHKKCAEIRALDVVNKKRKYKIHPTYLNEKKINDFLKAVIHE